MLGHGVLAATLAAAVTGEIMSLTPVPTVEIAPGVHMPTLSLGTWSLGNGDPSDPSIGVPPWVAAGGNGLDCAWDYFNQAAVAKAIQQTGVPREQLFITTKVPGGGNALDVVKTDLKQLGVDYVDLVLLHMPINVAGQYAGLEQALSQNLTRSIGVSNFDAAQLADLAKTATTTPAVNQCEMGIMKHDDATISYCQEHKITYEAWGTMKNCPFNSTVVQSIATAYNATAAQVCLRYVTDRGCVAAVGTGSTPETAKAYAAEDIGIFRFNLTATDMAQLSALQSQPLPSA